MHPLQKSDSVFVIVHTWVWCAFLGNVSNSISGTGKYKFKDLLLIRPTQNKEQFLQLKVPMATPYIMLAMCTATAATII